MAPVTREEREWTVQQLADKMGVQPANIPTEIGMPVDGGKIVGRKIPANGPLVLQVEYERRVAWG